MFNYTDFDTILTHLSNKVNTISHYFGTQMSIRIQFNRGETAWMLR